jgi:hypothetical protein
LTQTQDRVKAARERVKTAVEEDASLRGALKSLEQKNVAVEKAKSDVARARDKLSAAVARVNQQRGQLTRAVAADRKDDNKKNDNKKKNDKKPNQKK